MNDALASDIPIRDLIRNVLKRAGYTVVKTDKGWIPNGLLYRHRKDKPYRTEDEAWKACQNDYAVRQDRHYRKEHAG